MASARAETAALDVALVRLRSEPDSPEALQELGWLLRAVAVGQGARAFPEIARRARMLERAVRAVRSKLSEQMWLEIDALRHQLEAALASERLATALALGEVAEADEQALVRTFPVRQRLLVAVIGDGPESEAACAAAYRSGVALANAGTNLLVGGMGGVMQAAARGFREADGAGCVIGLLPGGERHAANPWVDVPLPTRVDQAQCALVSEAAAAAIAIGGGGGTLAEIGLLMRLGKPVAVVSSSGGISARIGGLQIGLTAVLSGDEPEEAVTLVLQALASGSEIEPERRAVEREEAMSVSIG